MIFVESSLAMPESDPVVAAVDRDQVSLVQQWIANHPKKIDERIQNSVGETLLMRSANKGSGKVFHLLLKSGANANVRDHRGTPLLLTMISLSKPGSPLHKKLEPMIRSLVLIGKANVNESDRAYLGDGRSPIHEAARWGNRKLIQFLVKTAKANVNAASAVGETALHLAAREGHYKTVGLLIQYGAKVNILTKHTKQTPLMLAAEGAHSNVIRLLLRKGAKRNLADTFGKKPEQRFFETHRNIKKTSSSKL